MAVGSIFQPSVSRHHKGIKIMTHLVISKAVINNSEVNSVLARELHSFLESKQDFSTWIKNRIKKYDFIENVDFIKAPQKNGALKSTTYGQEKIEYYISIDMAKELSMVENNEKGKEARRYFIECEKKTLSKEIEKTITPKDAVLHLEGYLEAAKLLQVPLHLAQIESTKLTLKATGIDFSPLLLQAPSQDDIAKEDLMLEPTDLGRRFGYSGAEMNRVLERLGLQTRPNGKDWIPTEQGDLISFYHSWNKNGKSGYNYKWNVSEVEKLMPKSL